MSKVKREYKTLYKKVEYCLEVWPENRNSDIALFIYLIKRFYGEYIYEMAFSERGPCIRLNRLWDLPQASHVERARRQIQNTEKRFLPTSEKVARARGFNIDEWKRALGYYVTPDGQLTMQL